MDYIGSPEFGSKFGVRVVVPLLGDVHLTPRYPTRPGSLQQFFKEVQRMPQNF